MKSRPKLNLGVDEPPARKMRIVSEETVEWRAALPEHVAVEMIGDNKNVIDWLNGEALAVEFDYRGRVSGVVRSLAGHWARGRIVPRLASADWFRHVYREFNKEADELANRAMNDQCSSQWSRPKFFLRPVRLRGWFDGGRRDERLSACGWIVKAAYSIDAMASSWCTVAWGSVLLKPGTSSMNAELTGAEHLCAAILQFITEQPSYHGTPYAPLASGNGGPH